MTEDYYKTLGVSKTATAKEIKSAYRKLSMKYHPDKNPDSQEAEDMFKKVSSAYEVLGDEEKRKEYDTYGPNGKPQDDFGGFSPFSNMNSFFHQRTRNQAVHVQTRITVPWIDVFKGTNKEVHYRAQVMCKVCEGVGHNGDGEEIVCPRCRGQRMETIRQGAFMIQKPCNNCSATGRVVKDPCGICYGKKVVTENIKSTIKIPKDVHDGEVIKIRKAGNYYPDLNIKSDLIVRVNYLPDDFFMINRADMHCLVPISLKTAIYGGEIKVPTPHGEAKIKIPEGTKSGNKFRIRGKGLYANLQSFGDIIVVIEVDIPSAKNKSKKFDESNFVYDDVESYDSLRKDINKRIK